MTTQLKKVNVFGFKKIKAIEIDVNENDLTVVGGKNRQGKTSLLDSVAWCLGGDKMKPSEPRNSDSETTELNVILNDNSAISRGGRNLSLSAKDASGNKMAQRDINAKVGQFALNLPKFMEASAKEKADILLQCLGIGDELSEIDTRIAGLEDDRRILGREKTAKESHAQELPEYKDAPEEEIVVSDLLEQQNAILEQNKKNEARRDNYDRDIKLEAHISEEVDRLKKALEEKQVDLKNLQSDNEKFKKEIDALVDGDVSEINTKIANAQSENAKIEANDRKKQAQKEADELVAEYKSMTQQIEAVREERISLMNWVEMPIEGIGVDDGEITYNGQKWDCMSDSERLIVAIAVARALNPECGFVIADRFEQMDQDTQEEIRQWCKDEGFQVLASRVSSNPKDCTLLIENGEVKQ